MYRILKTAPAGMPVTKEQVKTYAFGNTVKLDSMIDDLIPAAVNAAEAFTGRVFVNQVWEVYYDRPEFSNNMQLSTLNVNSIVAATTYSLDNTATVLDSGDYRLFNDQVIFLDSKSYSPEGFRAFQSVMVEVNAGYGADSTDQRKDIQTAIAQIVYHWAKTGNMQSTDSSPFDIPITAQYKLRPYVKRTHWL